jgi:hypothetical protein
MRSNWESYVVRAGHAKRVIDPAAGTDASQQTLTTYMEKPGLSLRECCVRALGHEAAVDRPASRGDLGDIGNAYYHRPFTRHVE